MTANTTNTSPTTFVLGSQDAEMAAIEATARASGARVLYAGTMQAGVPVRVTPGQNGNITFDPTSKEVVEYRPEFIGVEVAMVVATVDANGEVTTEVVQPVVDHHAPNDPRTTAPPERAFEASSIGQVCRLLGVAPTTSLVMAGESDHCLVAFANGKCSTPQEKAVEYILETRRAAFAKDLTMEQFRAAVMTAVETLKEFYNPEEGYADLRGLPIDGPIVSTGEQYPSRAQYLPVAACLAGIGYMVDIKNGVGRRALRIGGFEGPNPLLLQYQKDPTAFGVLGYDAPRPTNAYATPERGMAGGTYPA